MSVTANRGIRGKVVGCERSGQVNLLDMIDSATHTSPCALSCTHPPLIRIY